MRHACHSVGTAARRERARPRANRLPSTCGQSSRHPQRREEAQPRRRDRHDRRRGAADRLLRPAAARQDLSHPERLDGADARHRPARAREPHRHALRRSVGRRHRRLPPAEGRRHRGRRSAASRPRGSAAAALARRRRRSARTRRSSSASSASAATASRSRTGTSYATADARRDSFTNPCGDGQGCTFQGTITVPDGSFFMMGDNRGAVRRQPLLGAGAEEWVIGTTIATYWPPKRSASSRSRQREAGRRPDRERAGQQHLHHQRNDEHADRHGRKHGRKAPARPRKMGCGGAPSGYACL